MERLRPGSWPTLPALRTAHLSTSPAAKVSEPRPVACGVRRRRRHETQQRRTQQQALTQAPSAKQQAEQEQAGNSSAPQVATGWVSPSRRFWLLWLLASTSPAAAKISKPAAQKTQPATAQQQASTHASSKQQARKQSKSKPVAAQSSRFWLRLHRPPKFLSLRRSKSTQQQHALNVH
jgi:hypothetical protein